MFRALFVLVLLASPLRAFEVDVKQSDVIRYVLGHVVADIGEGGEGVIKTGWMCWADSGIYVDSNAPLYKRGGLKVLVQLGKGKVLDAYIVDGNRPSDPQDLKEWLKELYLGENCSAYAHSYNLAPEDLLRVRTINGTSKLSELIKEKK